MTDELPGINPDLVRQYADQYKSGDLDGLKNLCTIFDSLRRGELQARNLSQAYLNQIIRLQSSGATTQPRKILDVPSERQTGEARGEAKSQSQSSRKMAQDQSKEIRENKGEKSKEKITLDLEL